MKIIVCVKRVVDYNVKVRARADGSDVDIGSAKMSMNPFDEIAVEEAIRLKEAGHASEVIVLSMGVAQCQETIRSALAMGADRGVLVETDAILQPLAVAKLVKAVAEREQADLMILGKQAIDDDCNQTGQMLAALLGCAQATFACELSVENDGLTVSREIDGGVQSVRVKLPAVVTADLRLNEPRYVKLPDIMKAKKKPLERLTPEDLEVDVSPRLTLLRAAEPPKRQAGIKVAGAAELVEKLRNEAKVI